MADIYIRVRYSISKTNCNRHNTVGTYTIVYTSFNKRI